MFGAWYSVYKELSNNGTSSLSLGVGGGGCRLNMIIEANCNKYWHGGLLTRAWTRALSSCTRPWTWQITPHQPLTIKNISARRIDPGGGGGGSTMLAGEVVTETRAALLSRCHKLLLSLWPMQEQVSDSKAREGGGGFVRGDNRYILPWWIPPKGSASCDYAWRCKTPWWHLGFSNFRRCFQSDPVDFDRSSAALPERFAVSLRNHISYICSAYCLLVLNTPLPSCLLAFEWSHTGAQLSREQCILGTPILDLFNGRASGEDPSHKLKSF